MRDLDYCLLRCWWEGCATTRALVSYLAVNPDQRPAGIFRFLHFRSFECFFAGPVQLFGEVVFAKSRLEILQPFSLACYLLMILTPKLSICPLHQVFLVFLFSNRSNQKNFMFPVCSILVSILFCPASLIGDTIDGAQSAGT